MLNTSGSMKRRLDSTVTARVCTSVREGLASVFAYADTWQFACCVLQGRLRQTINVEDSPWRMQASLGFTWADSWAGWTPAKVKHRMQLTLDGST